jgi:hypothetical protein
MGEQPRNEQSEADRRDEYIRGGKGRKDEVGKSGIYPASSPDAPKDAAVRTEGELVGHKGAARRSPASETSRNKVDESAGSE